MAGVTIVAATREAEGVFPANTALGQTLAAYAHYGISTRLFYSNTRGLPERYNRAIDETTDEEEILIFLHDDVFFRQFERADLTMGTCSISIIHDSDVVNFDTPEGVAGYENYLQKWGQ